MSAKAFTLKAWLKDDDSIHKEVFVLSSHTFKDLHHTLMRAFELGMIKAVCFYICNGKWKKGQKIAFSNPTQEAGVITMGEASLGDFIAGDSGYIRYECRNGSEWLINIEVIEAKKPSNARRYPDWEDTSGVSLKQRNKRAPVMAVEDEVEEDVPEDDGDEEGEAEEGEESYGKDFGDLDVPDDTSESEEDNLRDD
jgi:hypothetical protein